MSLLATITLALGFAMNHVDAFPGPVEAGPTRSGPEIVAHRGASADAPENTIAAFRLGFEQGADAIEGDFRLTQDGHVVAMHDLGLERTTGDRRTVAEVGLEEIRTLDAGSWGRWKDREFAGEAVPTLAEVLAIVPEGKRILIEIKDSPRIVGALVSTLESSGIGVDQVTVISFDAAVIDALKRTTPKWKALWLTSFKLEDGSWTPSVDRIITTAKRIKADGVDVKAEPLVVDEGFVRAMRNAGMELHVWTVNDADVAKRMREVGVDSITTDRPAALRRALED